MPRNDSGCGERDGERGIGLPVDRRSYLKFAGAVVGSAGVFSGTAVAAERRGIRFQQVIDMVADGGCDPTGREACDAKIRRAADDYTLLKFPPGTYKLTEKNAILDKTNLGFLGADGARFTVPEWFNEKALVVDRGTGLLFENIDVDLTARGATPGLHLGAEDDLQIHDVEFVGQGVNPNNAPQECGNNKKEGCHGNEKVTKALYPIVRSPSGVGVVRNVMARNAGYMGTYTRTGIWIGVATEGTIRLEDCRIEEFPGNGLYCSRTYGVVQVEGGEFRNNDVSQVRIGSDGSYVRNAIIDVGATTTDSPNPEDALNQRGVWFESRKIGGNGLEIRDCEIIVADTPNSSGGVVTSTSVGDFNVLNTRIRVDADSVRHVHGYSPTNESHRAVLRNVSLTGEAANGQAVLLQNHPNSVVEDCCIQQDGADRDGVRIDNSSGSVVRNSTIDVPGREVDADSSVATSNISTQGSCPAPSGGRSLRGTLTIEGASAADYEFAVSGDLEKTTAANATIDPNDDLDGASATGQVGGGGRDSYAFSGEITRLVLDGGANLYYNGERIDPARFLSRTLTIEGAPEARYELATSEGLTKSTTARATADPNDDIAGRTATGQVGGGGRDSYAFSGEVTRLVLDGGANLYYNGGKVDPSLYLPNTLTIASPTSATYRLTTSDGVVKSTAGGATADPNDDISGASASGQVGKGGRDSYAFPGELVSLDVDGDATVSLNGEEIDPDGVGNDVLTIEGAPGTDYEFAVSGDLEKSRAMGGATIDSNDVLDGASVTGQVGGGGRDSYAFSGEITRLVLDGGANLYYNTDRVDASRFLPNTLTIESQTSASYRLTTSDGVVKSTAGGATVDSNDDIAGRTATGQVGKGGRDSYAFPGEIVDFDVDGDATVSLNGRRVSPGALGN